MTTLFKPMLAASKLPTLAEVIFPIFVSPKLDGIRATVQGGVVYSRSLKPIKNEYIQQLYGRPELEGFDGELIVGEPTEPDVYSKTSSGVMKSSGQPDVTYFVFDRYHPTWTARQRWEELTDHIKKVDSTRLQALTQMHIGAQDLLSQIEREFIEAGFEGAILRSPEQTYKQGRSTIKSQHSLKMKQFSDSEAEILSVFMRQKNENEAGTNELGRTFRSTAQEGMVDTDLLGGFNVRDIHTGVEFSLGLAVTDGERERLTNEHQQNGLIGALAKYKFMPYGVKEKPRHPIYLGLRDTADLS
ncbi:MAG: hypothetical protein WBC93_15535 [Sulfitobacter sp.]